MSRVNHPGGRPEVAGAAGPRGRTGHSPWGADHRPFSFLLRFWKLQLRTQDQVLRSTGTGAVWTDGLRSSHTSPGSLSRIREGTSDSAEAFRAGHSPEDQIPNYRDFKQQVLIWGVFFFFLSPSLDLSFLIQLRRKQRICERAGNRIRWAPHMKKWFLDTEIQRRSKASTLPPFKSIGFSSVDKKDDPLRNNFLAHVLGPCLQFNFYTKRPVTRR